MVISVGRMQRVYFSMCTLTSIRDPGIFSGLHGVGGGGLDGGRAILLLCFLDSMRFWLRPGRL